METDSADVQESQIGAARPVEELRFRGVIRSSADRSAVVKAIIERGAGIDVGKKFITACTLIGVSDAEPTIEKRLFGTFNEDLKARAGGWLSSAVLMW